MKHITLLMIAATLTCAVQGQVIFESGFESWTAGVPDDWDGSKTNISIDPEEVTDNVHGGTSAVRLTREGSGHQRFTTQPLSVENGATYTVEFWVRGNGMIRVGLFDERTTGSGYAPYTNYTTVSSDTWQEVSVTITAANTSSIAEFILSVQETVAPEHLVVDDVTISLGGTVDPPTEATIQEIQQTTAPDGASPMVDEVVSTSGVVTGFTGGSFPGFFIQDGSGAWSGIYVFHEHGTLQAGDRIDLVGTVAEFNGQTQLTGISSLSVVSSGNTVDDVVITTADANTEPYESVLVTVENAEVTAAGQFGQFTVNDGSGAVLVDDVIYAYPFVVGNDYHITGILQYAFNEWRILPRDENDVELSTGVGQHHLEMASVYPNPASSLVAIQLPGSNERVEYRVNDAAGRMIHSGILTQERTMIDVSGMPNGSYLITLIGTDAMWSTRMMVAR